MKNISVIPYPKKHEYISENTLMLCPSVYFDNNELAECAEIFGFYIKKLFDITLQDCGDGISLLTDTSLQSNEYIIDTTRSPIILYAGFKPFVFFKTNFI